MNDITVSHTENPFEDSKRIDDDGNEYWTARELQLLLGYAEWRNFHNIIEKAKTSCKNNDYNIKDNFGTFTNPLKSDEVIYYDVKEYDYRLSRYACYLVAQNGDPSKPQIAQAQSYFAFQTRRQEEYDKLPEEDKRLLKREHIKNHNMQLKKSAFESGVTKMGTFQDAGYMGLYGGFRHKEIQDYKEIGTDSILDRACSAELAANDFRVTQTEQKLNSHLKKGEKIGQNRATETHRNIGRKIRETMEDIGNPMPEDLKPEIHIKELKKKVELKKERKERPQLDI